MSPTPVKTPGRSFFRHVFGLLRHPRVLNGSSSTPVQDTNILDQPAQPVERALAAFKALADASPLGIFRADAKGQCVYVNGRWSEITGVSSEAARGEGWQAALHPDDRIRIVGEWSRMMKGVPFRTEYRFQRPDGTIRWVVGQAIAEKKDAAGALTGYVGTTTDITEYKRVENALVLTLLGTGSSLSAVLDTLAMMIEEQVPGVLCSIFLVEEDHKHLRLEAGPSLPEAFTQALKRVPIGPSAGVSGAATHMKQPVFAEDIETDALYVDSQALPLKQALRAAGLRSCWACPILSSKGQVLGTLTMYWRSRRQSPGSDEGLIDMIVHMARVAIERKQAEEALRASEQRYRSLVETAATVIIVLAPDHRIIEWNHEAERVYGYERREVLGEDYFQVFLPEEVRQDVAADINRVLAGKVTKNFESPIRARDGSERILLWNVSRLSDLQGQTIGIIASGQDITQRKRAEEALRESEERYRSLIQVSPDAIFINQNDRIAFVNSQGLKLLGAKGPEEILGKTLFEFIHPDYHSVVKNRIQRLVQRRQAVRLLEEQYVRLDGTIVDVEVAASSFSDHGAMATQVVVRDITERKMAEESLRAGDRAMRQLLQEREELAQNLHDGIIQSIYAVALGLEECRRLVKEDSSKAVPQLNAAIGTLNSTIQEVRNHIVGKPLRIESGQQLKDALERLVRTAETSAIMRIHAVVELKAADDLTHEEAGHVYYIAQEALSNAIRHSKARNAVLSLRMEGGAIRLEVSDDGSGFDLDSVHRGQGLTNLESRALKLGSPLQLNSSGTGTRVRVDIGKEGRDAR